MALKKMMGEKLVAVFFPLFGCAVAVGTVTCAGFFFRCRDQGPSPSYSHVILQ